MRSFFYIFPPMHSVAPSPCYCSFEHLSLFERSKDLLEDWGSLFLHCISPLSLLFSTRRGTDTAAALVDGL